MERTSREAWENEGYHFAGESFDLHLGGGLAGEDSHSRQSKLLGKGREVTMRREMGFRKKTQAF